MLAALCVLGFFVPAPVAHQVIQGVSSPVDALAVSADGYVASSHADGSIRIWRLDTRTLIRWIPGSQVPGHVHPTEMTWDDSTHELLLGAGLGGVIAIDLEGHTTTRATTDSVDRLRIAGANRIAGNLGTWRLEDAHGAKLGDVGRFGDVVMSADGKLALGADHKGLTLLTLPGRAKRAVIALPAVPLSADNLQPTALAISSDGSSAAACVGTYDKSRLVVIDALSTHPAVHPVALDLISCRVAISAAHSIAVVADVGSLTGVDTARGTVRWRFPIGYAMNGSGIELALSGRMAFASLPDGRIRVIDIVRGEPLGELGYAIPTPSAAWFAPGDHLVVRTQSTANGEVGVAAGADVLTMWDLASGETIARGNVDLQTAEVAEDGTLAVARYRYDMKGGCYSFAVGTLTDGAHDGLPTPDLWPPKPGQSSLECVGERVPVAIVDPNSGTIVTATRGKEAVIRPGKGPVALTAVGGGAIGMRLEVGGGGRWVLGYNLTGDMGSLFVWDSATGAKQTFTASPTDSAQASFTLGGAGPVRKGFTAYAMSSDGSQLAVGGADTVTVYEPAHKRVIRTVTVPSAGAVSSIALGSDGTLAIGMTSGTLALARAGAPPVSVTSAGGEIQRIRYRSDGKRIATVSEDGGVRIWNPGRGALAATFVSFADGLPLSVTPAGAYAGRSEAAERISWVFDAPTEGFRFERYAATFNRPDLVRARLENGTDDLATAVARPPRVSFAKQPPARVTKGALSVTAHVEATAGTVSDIRAYVDGRPSAAAHVGAASGESDLALELAPGIDVVTLVAFDDGGRASNPVSVEIDATHVKAPRPDIWVVAAGVGWYQGFVDPKNPTLLDDTKQLAAPVNDAQALVKALQAQAGPGKVYGAAHVTLLEDEGVTRATLESALRGLAAMKSNDVAVVFLAGHGAKPPDSKEMVFLPSTTAPDPHTWAATGIGWSTIAGALDAVHGRVVVLLDACHAGHMSTELLAPNTELADQLASTQKAGVFVFAASRGDQSALESNRSRGLELDDDQQTQVGRIPPAAKKAKPPAPSGPVHNAVDPHAPRERSGEGYFTGAVLASLSSTSTDVNRDGVVEISELVAAVQARVTIASRGRQTPWVVRRALFGDFGVARSSTR